MNQDSHHLAGKVPQRLQLGFTDLELDDVELDLKCFRFRDFQERFVRHAKDQSLTNPTPAGNRSRDTPPIGAQKNRFHQR